MNITESKLKQIILEEIVDNFLEQVIEEELDKFLLENDEDLTLPRHVWDEWRTKGYERIGEKSDDSEESSSEESSSSEFEKESSDESIDAEVMAVEEMAD